MADSILIAKFGVLLILSMPLLITVLLWIFTPRKEK